jgi:aspartyl/asparaginyl beta-hydroxylase (cupin superfamily)
MVSGPAAEHAPEEVMFVTDPIDEQVRGLVSRAERASAAGHREEAARLLTQAHAAAPNHPLILNASGLSALNAGDAAGARRLFEQAIAIDDRNPAFWLNLATAFRKLGLPEDETNALNRALTLEPRHLLALLQMASLLTLQGKARQAASVYKNALATIPPGARLPERLQPVVRRAMDAVRENDEELARFLEDRLREPSARYPDAERERFEHCFDLLTGRRRLYRPEPTFIHFPSLPAYEFYTRSHFPWLEELEQATPEIQAEFERVFAEDAGALEPYIAYPWSVPLDQWRELNHSRRWSVFFLWRDGAPVAEHLARCPRTAEMLARTPQPDVPEYGPTAFFSILDAKTRIPAHSGVTNTRLVVHLPLVIPEGCRFRVGSTTRPWRIGEAFVFDDTMEHEAWNDSDVPRAILIFDVWNPYLSSAERDLLRTLGKGLKDYYRGQWPMEAHL